jgi:hypothetical protein
LPPHLINNYLRLGFRTYAVYNDPAIGSWRRIFVIDDIAHLGDQVAPGAAVPVKLVLTRPLQIAALLRRRHRAAAQQSGRLTIG